MSIKRLAYHDTFKVSDGTQLSLSRLHVGGGQLLWPRDVSRIDELHFFPHGGMRRPRSIRRYCRMQTVESLAETIWANCDTGTPSLASELSRRLFYAGRLTRMLAFFDVSRAFIDANRTNIDEQIPSQLYRGNTPFRELSSAQKDGLSRVFVSPWLAAIQDAMIRFKIPVVIHHHSFDEHPNSNFDSEHVVDDVQPRPAAMLFQRYGETAGSVANHEGGLLPPEVLDVAKKTLSKAVQQMGSPASVKVDNPYTVPRMPLLPSKQLVSTEFLAFVYEIRKDLFSSKFNVHLLANVIDEVSAVLQQYVLLKKGLVIPA